MGEVRSAISAAFVLWDYADTSGLRPPHRHRHHPIPWWDLKKGVVYRCRHELGDLRGTCTLRGLTAFLGSGRGSERLEHRTWIEALHRRRSLAAELVSTRHRSHDEEAAQEVGIDIGRKVAGGPVFHDGVNAGALRPNRLRPVLRHQISSCTV